MCQISIKWKSDSLCLHFEGIGEVLLYIFFEINLCFYPANGGGLWGGVVD